MSRATGVTLLNKMMVILSKLCLRAAVRPTSEASVRQELSNSIWRQAQLSVKAVTH